MDDAADLVIANPLSPSEVCNGIIGAYTAGMTFTLKSVTTDTAARESSVARSVIDGICSMAKVIDASMRTFLVVANVITWRGRKPQTTGSKCFGERLEGDGRQSKGQTKKRGDDTSKRMTSQPDVGVRIEFSDIVIQLLSGLIIVSLVS